MVAGAWAAALLAVTVDPSKHAVVTLITSDDGYVSGALALGGSLDAVGSKLHRVCMVTSDVSEAMREILRPVWEVREVEPIACNHKMNESVTSDRFDLTSPTYLDGIAKWKNTCTKFAAFTLEAYERVLFLDADTVVVNPLDDVLFGFSNATIAAAPETFPPDTFNSGVMVLTPSARTLRAVLAANEETGTAEGGDQGVLNQGYCRHWFNAAPDDPACGRLPWIFNVNAANYAPYKALREMTNERPVAVVHFVSSNKPWKHVAAELSGFGVPAVVKRELESQAGAHRLWRDAYLHAKTLSAAPRLDSPGTTS